MSARAGPAGPRRAPAHVPPPTHPASLDSLPPPPAAFPTCNWTARTRTAPLNPRWAQTASLYCQDNCQATARRFKET